MDRGLARRVKRVGQKADHDLTVCRVDRVRLGRAVSDRDVRVPRARLGVGARLRRRTRPVVRLLWTEAVIEAGRHQPGGNQIHDRGARKRRETLHRARSAITWPMMGATRSLQAHRHRPSRSPAAATAPRNSGGCDSACASVQRTVVPAPRPARQAPRRARHETRAPRRSKPRWRQPPTRPAEAEPLRFARRQVGAAPRRARGRRSPALRSGICPGQAWSPASRAQRAPGPRRRAGARPR